jgi:hypothetical protein
LVEAKDLSKDDSKSEKTPEQDVEQDALFQQPIIKTSKPTIAGILLIIAAIIALLFFVQIVMVNDSTIQSVYNSTQSQITQNVNMTQEQLKQGFVICGTVGCIMAVLSILGGILSLKRKIWGLALVVSIPQSLLGIIVPSFSLLFVSGVMALVGLLLIAFSRREFQ